MIHTKAGKNLSKENHEQILSRNSWNTIIGHLPLEFGCEQKLIQNYSTEKSNKQEGSINGIGLFAMIIDGTDDRSALKFIKTFVYGVEMTMWRKQNKKKVMVFIDSHLPVLVWFSSPTKSFLFDMTYTDIDYCDYEIEKESNCKHYFILRYFQEEIPLLFEDNTTMQKYYQLFHGYIKYNRLRQYPPYFSRVIKLYTMEEVKSSISRRKVPLDISNVTKAVFGVCPENSERILGVVYRKSRNKDMKLDSELSTKEIRDYFSILHCSVDLIKVFQNYSKKKLSSQLDYLEITMKKSQLIDFLVKQQKQSQKKVQEIAEKMKEEINFYQFCIFLQNQKINHAAQAIEIDQNLPLTDYFCYSSHNTYLSGNQITSDSKIQRYIEDFDRGLKCVEIDIHNDGDIPIVTHAIKDKSLCTPIDFEETIKQIAKYYEYINDHYPIIISLQNHSKQQNRYKVSYILLKYLIKRIFFINEAYKFQHPTVIKTLNELKGKFIIKTDSKLQQVLDFHRKTIFSAKIQQIGINPPGLTFPSQPFQQRYNDFQSNVQKMLKRRNEFDISIPDTLFLPISQMAKVTSLFKSKNGVDNPESNGYQCTSLTNQKAISRKQEQLIEYTKRSFLRTYPVGTEISSNNYDPAPLLKIGAQIIALNTQTKDDYAWMVMSYFKAGRFGATEKIGYIPKPEHLRSQGTNKKRNNRKIISIKIISNHKNVNIKFFGTKRDMDANSQPNQNSFSTIDYDQSFLMFTINDNLKECIPIRFIRPGYRVLVVKNKLFKDSGIRIIIHITIN